MTDRFNIKNPVARRTVEKLRRKYLKVQEKVPRNLRSHTNIQELQERPLKNPFRRSTGLVPQQLAELLPVGLFAAISQQEMITVREIRRLPVPTIKEDSQTQEASTALIGEAMSTLENCLKQLPERLFHPVLAQLQKGEREPFQNIPSQSMLVHQNIEELCDIGISSPKDHKSVAVEERRRRRDSDGFL